MFFTYLNGLVFKLNKNDFTASVSYSPKSKGNIFIPRSINNNDQKYIVTSIGNGSFKNNVNINSILIPDNSELKIIHKNAFLSTKISSIFIPPKLEKLEDGWCKGASYLFNVKIHPNNKNFIYLDKNHQIIAGKSTENENKFDVLIFASRDVDHFTIPSTIKHISPYSFYECYKLQKIDFEENSQLLSIGKNAFSYSSIVSIFVPSNVEDVGDAWLGDVSELSTIKISSSNKYFSYLDDDHNIIVGKSSKSNENFDTIIFASHEIEKAFIPATIKYINSFSFSYCRNLKTIEFERGSQLVSIGKYAFSSSSLEHITFPKSIEKVKKCAFLYCASLKSIHFEEKSNLNFLDSFLICGSSCEHFEIPSKLAEIKNDCFANATDLNEVCLSSENKNFAYLNDEQKIIISKSNLKNDIFDTLFFACRDIENVFIPSSIKFFAFFAFAHCLNLKSFQFCENSELASIGTGAFMHSSIKKIKIPKSVTLISEMAFFSSKLKKIDFSTNSKNLKIQNNAFGNTLIHDCVIYSSECVLGEKAFMSCVKLRSFEFLGENLTIEPSCFDNARKFLLISLPNCLELNISYESFLLVNCTLYICSKAKVNNHDK